MLKPTLAGLALLGLAGHAAAADNPLSAELWKTRPLVVLAERADDPLLAEVRTALQQPANREAFVEREMVLYTVIGDQGRRNDQPLSAAATRGLLDALEAGDERPQLVLVGKDGGKKIQRSEGADLPAIFATIDRMPMRRAD